MDKLEHIEAQLTQLITAQAIQNQEHRTAHEAMKKMIDGIHAGMYGDEANGYIGVVKGHHDQEKRIKSLEDSRSRIKWTLSGIAAAMQGTIIGIYEYFKDKL